jgi:hypothetical protein
MCKRFICIWSQYSLCRNPSLALGVKVFIIVIYETSNGGFFTSFVDLSLGHDLQVRPGLFPVAFPVAFPLLGLPPGKHTSI